MGASEVQNLLLEPNRSFNDTLETRVSMLAPLPSPSEASSFYNAEVSGQSRKADDMGLPSALTPTLHNHPRYISLLSAKLKKYIYFLLLYVEVA
jgi:hypothetical protein